MATVSQFRGQGHNFNDNLDNVPLAFGNKVAWNANLVSIEATCASALPTNPRALWGPRKRESYGSADRSTAREIRTPSSGKGGFDRKLFLSRHTARTICSFALLIQPYVNLRNDFVFALRKCSYAAFGEQNKNGMIMVANKLVL